jgi:NAD(P)H-quinone oxidoreductase subunit 6
MSGPAEYIFYAAAAMTVGAAILVAILPNILYAAVALLFSFAGVAGLYVLLSADFLAATQILVYVGGIIVLLLFAVFLSNRISAFPPRRSAWSCSAFSRTPPCRRPTP